MNITKKDLLIKRVQTVLGIGESAIWHGPSKEPIPGGTKYTDERKFGQFRASALSLITDLYGKEHVYYVEFAERCGSNSESDMLVGYGIMKAIYTDIDNGYFDSVKGIISAELFSDFMEMASHLLEEKYKDPAAVIIGSVLEEHLRQLCQKNNIDLEYINQQGKTVTKKADTLNNELGSKAVYRSGDKKQVTAWLDLRNNAAHGHYTEYDLVTIKNMHQGVQLFIDRNPL